jgi:hypothetical protein
MQTVWDKLGRMPERREMDELGRYRGRRYYERWGGWRKACEAFVNWRSASSTQTHPIAEADAVSPEVSRMPSATGTRESARLEYGEPIDFRGLRHAPINEQGVVYLFGMVSRELGFSVEAVRSHYPDCEAKRQTPGRPGRWERVKIEFEFQSSNFRRDHMFRISECDILVCWEHDWPDCPLEVIPLKSVIAKLPSA